MPVYTATSRQTAYETLLRQRKGRRITAEVFQREKAKIDRREAKSVAYFEEKRRQKAREAEARREAKKEATRARNIAKKEALKISPNLLTHKVVVSGDVEDVVRDIWKRMRGTTIRVIGTGTNGLIFDNIVNVLTGDAGYKEFRLGFLETYDGDWLISGGDTILVMLPSQIEARRLIQRFRDGITNCVFTPILAKLTNALENASDGSKSRLRRRIKQVKSLELIYEDGVPEDKMDEVGRASGMVLPLYDILVNDLAVYNKGGRMGAISMTNTRENHVEIGLVVNSDPLEISQRELIQIWNGAKTAKEFYMIDGDLQNGLPRKIRTLQGAWAVEDSVMTACKEFDKELGIINYKINALKQPMLNAFLKSGRIVNGWSCSLGSGEATGCADMPSAYSQFKKCHMYQGFLGHVHQFRSGVFDKDFVYYNLGYYEVKILGGVSDLMAKLGLYVGQSLVLFSPELLYFMNDGLEVDITQGAWGSRFDFDFPDYMMKDRAYCTWAGRLGIERSETSHTISASPEWASHLACEHKVFYWKQDELLTIKKPVKQCFTAHHIFGGITAYVRIQMMEAMKMFEPQNLVRVVLDGIYYSGEKPAGLEWFSDKKVKVALNDSMSWYSNVENETFPPMGRIVKNTLLTGQGGSGKTYSVFTDKGYNTILYVSPSNILGQDVQEKYGAKYTTIHKLIGIDCQPYHTQYRTPPVIFIDEITQIEAEWVDEAFEMYPDSLILLAGDVDASGRWFQCRSGGGKEWNKIWKPSDVDVVEFLEDRRSRDDKLKALKLGIRNIMNQCNLDEGLFQMEDWSRRTLPLSKFEFTEGDTCIAGTHRTNKKLLDMGVVSGYYKKGGFVSSVEKPGFEKRGSFTIHSYQGKTIETGNIWIFIDDLFEYAMLYTAVSRAVSYSQIKFVRARDL